METVKLLADDVVWILRRIPQPLREYMEKVQPGKIFLAGGFIRAAIAGEEISDIDLFTPNKEAAKAGANAMAAQMGRPGHSCHIHETKYAYTVPAKPYPIQFIHRWSYDTPEKCVLDFDFTIAQSAVWFNPADGVNGWDSCASDRFYADLAAKRLAYLSPDRQEDPGGSFLRLLKFYQRGYRIPLDSAGAVIARLIGGVQAIELLDERRRGEVLTGLLREVDPNTGFHVAYMVSAPKGDESASGKGILLPKEDES
jgi:hypothetical protein